MKNTFQLHNRRFLGNKYKLINFIEKVVKERCGDVASFCDIFAGTGVVGAHFNSHKTKIISNDILYSNYLPLTAFLKSSQKGINKIDSKIDKLNKLNPQKDNYFSDNFGGTYFTKENARKIGAVREKINEISEEEDEKATLITSLMYAADKIANTVGHYDAYREKLDMLKPLKLSVPDIRPDNNVNNEIYNEDGNQLIKNVECDVLYVDPPYNSRQYSDTYHLLENLAKWEKPPVFGKARKMDRSNLKSRYCMKTATEAFDDLIQNARCKYIIVSYNNTGDSKDGRSNARISDEEIIAALKKRGKVEKLEKEYKAFTAGKSNGDGHKEHLFYCEVKR